MNNACQTLFFRTENVMLPKKAIRTQHELDLPWE